MYNLADTIAAIATPPGESALAIVRLSGAQSKKIGENIFTGNALEIRKAVFGRIVDSAGQPVDEVVAIYYRSPQSFTGEDMLEIICHGGHVVGQQIISLCCANGARLAQPGEFTLRAFLNGKVDLTEAEAIDLMIRSRTDKAKALAMHNLEGRLHNRLESTHAKLFELITIYEAQIDFADDEINKIPTEQTLSKLTEIKNELSALLDTYDIGRLAEGRTHIAIVGAPNVGKSTLFNALLEIDRAIVTDVPGTTRDYLSEHVNIGGYPAILTDTAGIRESTEAIESIGVGKTHDIIDKSDLILFVIDGSRTLNDEDVAIKKMLDNHKYILIVNKSDKVIVGDYASRWSLETPPLNVSAKTKVGLEILNKEIERRLVKDTQTIEQGVLLSQRQYDCAKRSLLSCNEVVQAISNKEPEEINADLMRECLNSIGEMVGKVTNDDILNEIFGRFCIGK